MGNSTLTCQKNTQNKSSLQKIILFYIDTEENVLKK